MTPVQSWLIVLALLALVVFGVMALRCIAGALQDEADTIEDLD